MGERKMLEDSELKSQDNRYDDSTKPISVGFDLSKLDKCQHHWYRKSYSQIRCEKCTMELIDVGNIDVTNGELKLKTANVSA
jgi:hypothetical protein